jgi:4-hydroxy-4-methyl-2-oxoglutarate aldolase
MMRDDSAESCVRRLRRLDCCAVSDALDRLKLAGVVGGLPPRSGTGKIAGCVVTMKLGLGDPPPGPPRHLGCSAIEASGPLDVIVVEQLTGIEAGSWGGILSLGAKLRGIAGVISEGCVRDIDEAITYGFPIFSRGVTALTARGRIVEKGFNVPISIGRVEVNAGDYVIADASAVAFIAVTDIERVLDVAEGIVAKEAAMAKALLAGTPVSEVMGGHYENMLRT